MTRNLHLKSKDKKFRTNLPVKFTFIFHTKKYDDPIIFHNFSAVSLQVYGQDKGL